MIIQENDFLKTYNEIDCLWEDALGEPTPSAVTTIKGQQYKFITSFMPAEQLTKEDFSRPGIYVWQRLPQENKASAYYVGKSKNLYERTKQHIKPGEQDSVALHAALKKYGLDKFVFAVIEFCTIEKLNDRERFWIKELNTYLDKQDYNLTPGGDGGRGLWKVTPEMFEQIVDQLQNSPLTFHEIGDYWGLDSTTIGDINKGRFAYIKELANILNIELTLPIRSKDSIQRITKDTMKKVHDKQAKTWNLIVTFSHLSTDGQAVLKTGSKNLGRFTGKEAVWDRICEIEREDYGTTDEEFTRAYSTFKKGNRPVACFGRLTAKKFARRYTIEETINR